MLDDSMELSDQSAKEIDESARKEFIRKGLAESLEEYYKLVDEAEELDIVESQQDLESSDDGLVEDDSSTKDMKNNQNVTQKVKNLSDQTTKTLESSQENSEENLQRMVRTTPVTVRRTMWRPRSIVRPTVIRRPIIRTTSTINRSPIVRRTVVRPVYPSTPFVRRPSSLPTAQGIPRTRIVRRYPVIHRTNIYNPAPAIRRQVVIRQTVPSCGIGYYWSWINNGDSTGMCVKDYENSCGQYDYNTGACEQCLDDFVLTRTLYNDNYCLKKGEQMPNLAPLQHGKVIDLNAPSSGLAWWMILLIVIGSLSLCCCVTKCACAICVGASM